MRRATYAQAKDFIDKVMVANRLEIYASELASRYAQRAEVRRFAARMVEDHLETGADLAATLERAAIEPPVEALDIALGGKIVSLRPFPAQGDFDDSFLAQQIEIHEGAIDLMGAYAAHGETPELQAFAARTLPRLEEHLRMARALTTA